MSCRWPLWFGGGQIPRSNFDVLMPHADEPRDEILARLAEIRAVIQKTDETLRTARDLEKHLEVVLKDVGSRLHSKTGQASRRRERPDGRS
jgi:hypothetical protein